MEVHDFKMTIFFFFYTMSYRNKQRKLDNVPPSIVENEQQIFQATNAIPIIIA